MNSAIKVAKGISGGLLALNNDVIFTKDWNVELLKYDDRICIPVCNQNFQYVHGDLTMKTCMDWADFLDRYQDLEAIRASHVAEFFHKDVPPEVLMSFYCFYVPPMILNDVGLFDEEFGGGGAEDVDYRLRVLLAGYDVIYAPRTYILHFLGKSTWPSDEDTSRTAERYARYREHFISKWGEAMADFFLIGGARRPEFESSDLVEMIERRDFREITQKLMKPNDLSVPIAREDKPMQCTSPMVKQFQEANPIQMELDEIEKISSFIRDGSPDGLMVEWGSGASTIRWLQDMRRNQRLISIEHNKDWYVKVKPVVDSCPELSNRFEYYLCEGSAYWDHGYGQVREENPVGLDRYFAPDDRIFDADIFLVDGIARGVCLLTLLQRSRKSDPVIFIHDWYPRREWYSWAVRLFPRSERVGPTLLRLSKGW